MSSIIRGQILEAKDIESELVEVPQWGVTVEVKGMSGRSRARFLNSVTKGGSGQMDFEKFYASLIILTTYDPETGELVFEKTDLDALNEKAGAALQVLAEVAMRLSGLSETALKDAEEDLDETRNADSSSS